MGPIIIFDKSTLQSLSVDESCWLENFFLTNITPIFFIETLADLEKQTKGEKTPRQMVHDLALKTPQNSSPNVHHHRLIVSDFLGYNIEMSNRPIISGGEFRVAPNGRLGVHFNQFPEAEAMQRWQNREFLEVEHGIAKIWRQSLSDISFDSFKALIKNIVPQGKQFKNLEGIKSFVDSFVKGNYKELLYLAFEIFGFPSNLQARILSRWLNENCPPISDFAPYASYVLKVDLFFYLCLLSNLISEDRPSNKIDLAYLYYLPFCMVFTSNDKLHKKTAPLFMEKNQVFINGQDLKSDLKILDDYYSSFPDDIKEQGIMKFAVYPPENTASLTSQLWDRFLPLWRKHLEERKFKPPISEDSEKEMVRNLKKNLKESVPIDNNIRPTLDNADRVLFKRMVLIKKGKWRILPPEVEKHST